jgi:hypothetical protein
VTAYVLASQRLCARDALELVKARRTVVCPNSGFLAQLDAYAARLGITGASATEVVFKAQQRREALARRMEESRQKSRG